MPGLEGLELKHRRFSLLRTEELKCPAQEEQPAGSLMASPLRFGTPGG